MPTTSDRLRFATDRRGFVRRACPRCGREFKLAGGGAEERVLQAAFHAYVIPANAEEVPGLPCRFCPYCGYGASADVFLTPDQRDWVEGWARHVEVGVRHERLRYVERHLGANPYVTFVPLAPVEPAPAAAPEPDDMTPVTVECCGERLKLRSNWAEGYFCPHCRSRQGA